MSDSRVSKSFRITAGIMSVMMLVIMLLSSLYIASETDHECTGDECPVCSCLDQCDNTLHQAYDGTVMLIAVVPFFLLLFSVISTTSELSDETLVSVKVRMNN